jgi:hypothetical protein
MIVGLEKAVPVVIELVRLGADERSLVDNMAM